MINNKVIDVIMSEEDIRNVLGKEADEFLMTMALIQEMVDNPDTLMGTKAILYAAKLSAYRTKVGTIGN